MQRILRRQGAKPEVVRAAGLMACDACGESIRQKRPKPVRRPSTYQFNQHILADTFCAKTSQGKSLAFLNVVCAATGFQAVSCLGELTGTPSFGIVLRHFLAAWSYWAGLPHSLQVDCGKEYMAQFSDYLKQYGVEQQVIPLESPWQNGKCERAGGLWKEVWAKTVVDVDVSTLADAITATSIVTQIRNAFPRFNGDSPNQWFLGHPETRLPGSLLSSDGSQQLEFLEAAENPHNEMARTFAIREAARAAQIRFWILTAVRGEPCCRRVHQQEGYFPSVPLCASTVVSLNSDNKMAAPTTGMGLRESLDFSATHAAQKTAIQPLMGQLPTAIGCDMGQAFSWHLVNN